jgi:hypothetical protein
MIISSGGSSINSGCGSCGSCVVELVAVGLCMYANSGGGSGISCR